MSEKKVVQPNKPKFKTPRSGGSYFKAADDDKPAVLAVATDVELTPKQKQALETEKGKVEKVSASK